MTETGLSVHRGTDASLELVVSSRTAQLSGRVLTNDSLPAVGASVVLIPDPPRRGLKDIYFRAGTDQNGAFTILGVAPGDYKAFSWDSVGDSDEPDSPDWFDAEWLKPFETKGVSVHLNESDQRSLQLTVIEADKAPSTSP